MALHREDFRDYECYRGEWQDDSSKIRLHWHFIMDQKDKDKVFGDIKVRQLIVYAVGMGPTLVLDETGGGKPLDCDMEV